MTTQQTKTNVDNVYEIAIIGRAVWNLHSLNNEGTVGNVTEPRTVVLADGRKTDGISGEMLKHIHAEKMWELENNKENFCDPCKQLKPERADGNKNVRSKQKPEDAVKVALTCTLCDIHGFLLQKPTAARPSLVEFGWALGIPQVYRDIHTHARHSVHEQNLVIEEEREPGAWDDQKCSVSECNTDSNTSKLYKYKDKWYCEEHLPEKSSQMVYHRPTRSGIYAIITVFQPWKIGLNNVSMQYDIEDDQRIERYKLSLKAYEAMFLRPEGAMTSTRLPHIENFEGVIVVSKINYPVPIISPLRENYVTELEEITKKIEEMLGTQLEIKKFSNINEFCKEIGEILTKTNPYKIYQKNKT